MDGVMSKWHRNQPESSYSPKLKQFEQEGPQVLYLVLNFLMKFPCLLMVPPPSLFPSLPNALKEHTIGTFLDQTVISSSLQVYLNDVSGCLQYCHISGNWICIYSWQTHFLLVRKDVTKVLWSKSHGSYLQTEMSMRPKPFYI